jgi:hypothetical protein
MRSFDVWISLCESSFLGCTGLVLSFGWCYVLALPVRAFASAQNGATAALEQHCLTVLRWLV